MNCVLHLLLLLTSALSQADVSIDEMRSTVPGIDPRIVGGQAATVGQFPYQVFQYIINDKGTYCSGILVAADMVLTSRFCTNQYQNKPDQIKIVAGIIDATDESSSVQKNVTSILLHDNEDECPLSIMKLESKFDVSGMNIGTIKLRETEAETDTSCKVSAWGDSTDILSYVEVPIYDKGKCTDLWSGTPVGKGIICAGTEEGGKGACTNDKGGALVCDGVLTGVVGNNPSCDVTTRPSLFTDVFYCREWINAQINNAVMLNTHSFVVYSIFIILTQWMSRS